MKKLLTITVLFLFVFTTMADAQRWRTRRWESFGGIGTVNTYGDIGGHRSDAVFQNPLGDIRIDFTRPSLSGGIKYKINHRHIARVNLAGAFMQGNDLETDNTNIAEPDYWGDIATARYGGYAFKSWVFEPSLMYEFYILPEARSMVSDALFNRKGMVNGFTQINVYAFVGIGSVISFPTVTLVETGAEFVTDDYQEGVPPFKNVGLAIPFGIAARMDLTSYWTIAAEFGRRYTFTDYIDGYTSKFSSATDAYDFVQVVFSYKIRTDKNGWPVLRKTGLH